MITNSSWIQFVKLLIFPAYVIITEVANVMRYLKQLREPNPKNNYKEVKYLATLASFSWAIGGVLAITQFIMMSAVHTSTGVPSQLIGYSVVPHNR